MHLASGSTVGGHGRDPKFWYIGSKFMQERAKFSNLKSDRELKRKLEQLANAERSRLYDLQQEIYAIRGVYRTQKMEKLSTRLNADLNAKVDDKKSSTTSLSSWIAAADIGSRDGEINADERDRYQPVASLYPQNLDGRTQHTTSGFIYRPIDRPRSIHVHQIATHRGQASASKNPNPRELLMTLIGEKFPSEQAIKERIAKKHKVDYSADEYTDGALAYAKRQLHQKKSRIIPFEKEVAEPRQERGKEAKSSRFHLNEKELRRLQVAHQQISYNQALQRVDEFLGDASSSKSRKSFQPALTNQESKIISQFASIHASNMASINRAAENSGRVRRHSKESSMGN